MIDEEYVAKIKDELYEDITLRKNSIELLLDFATGYKKLPDKNFRLIPYQKNDLRLISSIKQIHIKIRELEKEYKLLNKMFKKKQGEK